MSPLSVRIFLIFFGLYASGLAQIRAQNRVQIGLEQDNNVLESLSHAQSDQSARLLISTRAWWQHSHGQVTLSGQAGVQGYRQVTRDHKSIQQLMLTSRINVSGTRLGMKGWVRNKVYFNKNHDYTILGGAPFWSVPFFDIHTISVGVETERLAYSSFPRYNYHRLGITGLVRTRLSRQLLISAMIINDRYQVNRPALRYHPTSFTWQTLGEDIENREMRIGMSVDWFSGWLLQASVFYGNNRSNSQGFAFRRWILSLNTSREINTVLVRLLIHLQHKTYTDDHFPDLPVDIDSEREESNFVIFDLSFPIFPAITLLSRISWYRNASPFPMYYYDKVLFDIGLEYRF
ncbi:hypothetical protein GF406_15450 [candidate division KSB1 bacterium]|nr:hypothetical protein [candidate division KSB1 bacterium]